MANGLESKKGGKPPFFIRFVCCFHSPDHFFWPDAGLDFSNVCLF